MNTLKESSASVEGVLDVSIIVPACFENPLKEHAVSFLADTLSLKRRALIPVVAVLGAYHILTRYLGVGRVEVRKILQELLRIRSPSLYGSVAPELASDALDYATIYGIESWDGYLIAVSRSLGSNLIYSLDEELSKAGGIIVTNPFPKEAVQKYHRYLENILKIKKSEHGT